MFSFDTGNKPKHVENGGKSQRESDSQASSTSRKDSIENVLSILTESNSVKIEPFLSVTMLLLIGSAILCFQLMF